MCMKFDWTNFSLSLSLSFSFSVTTTTTKHQHRTNPPPLKSHPHLAFPLRHHPLRRNNHHTTARHRRPHIIATPSDGVDTLYQREVGEKLWKYETKFAPTLERGFRRPLRYNFFWQNITRVV
ncbi:hypothetical protein P8452_51973 [Trifolium repens]|nr:hypothetical protein P8452_51973 [Trifolium repens]